MRCGSGVRLLRLWWVVALCASATGGCYWGETDEVTPIVPRTSSKPPLVPLGLNLGSLNYYSPTLAFVDVMKNASEPETTGAGGNPWNTELMERLPRDSAGYPLAVPYTGPGIETPQWVRYSVARLIYPGRYTLLYDGEGEFEFPTVPVQVASKSPGMWRLDVPARDGSLFLTITRSQRDNHVRNLRLLLPGFDRSVAPNTFHPRFLERLRGASVLRFMDWQRTNNSTLSAWKDRAVPESSQATSRGAAFEVMIDLASQAGADPWFCVPHLADDDFVEQLATLVRDRLAPGRVVYVEYSNELWNVIFSQADFVMERGCAAGFDELPPKVGSCASDAGRMWAGVKWTAQRAAQVFEIFERVFGGSERLVRVLGGQAAGAGRNSVLLEAFNDPAFNPRGVRADALAIAPYFGNGVAAVAAGSTIDAILRRTEATIPRQVRDATRENKRIADYFGLRLVAYEGGQHLVASGQLAENDEVTELLIAANRDPRMAVLYEKMFDAWYEESDGELMVLFNSAELPGKHGSWGLLESQEQPLEAAPKYRAFRERLAQLAR